MKENLIIALLACGCLLLAPAALKRAITRLLDWNLRRQFFLAGSEEPTTIVDYLAQRERFRASFRTHPSYNARLSIHRAAQARHRALPDARGRVEYGVHQSGPRRVRG